MRYYSPTYISAPVALSQAITAGIAPDGSSYEPATLRKLPPALFRNMCEMSIDDIAYVVLNTLFGDDIDSATLKDMAGKVYVCDMPLGKLSDNRFVMDLTQGPSSNFKDYGTALLTQMLRHFNAGCSPVATLMAASSGTTARALINLASSYHDLDFVLLMPHQPQSDDNRNHIVHDAPTMPNVRLLRVNGSIEQCRRLVSQALTDTALMNSLPMTAANSLNIGSHMAEVVIHFVLYARLQRMMIDPQTVVVSIPSEHPSLFRAAKVAQQMGLPISRYVLDGCTDSLPPEDTVVTFTTERKGAIPSSVSQMLISPTLACVKKTLLRQPVAH